MSKYITSISLLILIVQLSSALMESEVTNDSKMKYVLKCFNNNEDCTLIEINSNTNSDEVCRIRFSKNY